MTPSSRQGKSLALVLRVIDYSETSQIVHLYARELGRVHAIAKGSKRKKSAFRGGFDVVSLVEILRIEKDPGTLDLLTSAETFEIYPELRRDWNRFSAAAYALDLLDEFTPEAMPQPELFDAARATLDAIEAGASVVECVFRFEARFLDVLGHFPRLDACGTCRRPLTGSDAWFSVRDGGVSLFIRSNVCCSIERFPSRQQYCLGIRRPNLRHTYSWSRTPSPPANASVQSK